MSKLAFYSFKDKSLRRMVIDLLSIVWPLSTTQLHKSVSEKFGVNVSYQAVHKAVQQLVADGCLLKEKNRFRIGEDWIQNWNALIQRVEASYKKKYSVPERILKAKETQNFNFVIAKNGVVDKMKIMKLKDQKIIRWIIDLFT